MNRTAEGKRKKLPGLSVQIFLALLTGAVLGAALNAGFLRGTGAERFLIDGIFYVAGQGFIRLMRMLVVPLVFCSLVCGSMAAGDTKKLGSVGVRTLAFYLLTTALAVAMALGIAYILRPGEGLNLSEAGVQATEADAQTPEVGIQTAEAVGQTTEAVGQTTEGLRSEQTAQEDTEAAAAAPSAADTLLELIPVNIFEALSNGSILQIIVFAMLLGIVLGKLGERAETVQGFFSQCNNVFMELTMIIMKLAPVGVFCLIAKTFAEIGPEALVPLLRFILCVLLALAVQCFGVYLGLLKLFTGLNPLIFLKKFFPVMAFAFSTSSSNASIPMSIDILEDRLGISRGIASFTIPLGATINMDGTSILQGVAVMFTAQAFGVPLGMTDYLTVIGTATLASVGTAGIPGVGLITLTMVFQAVGLPVEGIALIMGVDRILDMARTAVNVTGDAVCTAIVAFHGGAVDKERFHGSEKR